MLNLSINEQKQIIGGVYKIAYFNSKGTCIARVGSYSTQEDAAAGVNLAKHPGAVSYEIYWSRY